MAKMKIYELAKELDKQSKDIVTLLQKNGVDVANHMSSIDDKEINLVKEKLGKKSVNQAESDAKQKANTTEEHPQKKKKIIFVSNPQNSNDPKQASRNQGNTHKDHSPKGNREQASGNRDSRPQPPRKHVPVRPTMPGSEDFVELVSKNTLSPTGQKSEPKKPVEEAAKPVETKVESPVVKAEESKAEAGTQKAEVRSQTTQGNDRPNRTYENRGDARNNDARQSRPYNNNRPADGRSNDTHQSRPYNNNRPTDGRTYNNNRPTDGRTYNNNRPTDGRTYNNNRPTDGRTYNNNRPTDGRTYNNNRPTDGRTYNNNRPTDGTNNDNRQSRPYNNNRPTDSRSYNNNRPTDGRTYNNNRPTDGRTYNNNRPTDGRTYNNNRFYGKDEGADKDERDNRNHGSRDQGRARTASSDTPSISLEKRKDDTKRRNTIIKKDKNNKKEKQYEEQDNLKPGRFIKPEKKANVVEETIKVVVLPEVITIKDLASQMKIQPSTIVKKLFLEGKIVTVNQEITYEEAEEIAIEYDIICEKEKKVDVIAELLKEDDEDSVGMVARPPVICVMGHVDHGKTSLLDAIKETNVTDKEAGGITQHIGAYTVKANGKSITFLDTPGHEAFTSMRMRGAKSTDIAVLVVAADDGVMPQTIEAINHAKAAEIEIIVAINKIDKPNANIERVKQELTEHELVSEEWGGSTVFVPVSAKTGEGIEKLLEMIQLTAEVLEFKANPDRSARGLVIEAKLDKGRGSVASLLVQKGTLHVGDYIAVGPYYGKVRAMIDDKHKNIKEAGPSQPVEILGLNGVPDAGDIFVSPENDREAKQFAETYISHNKEKMLDETKAKMSLDDLFSQIQEGNLKELKLIVKADVQGSVEAIKQSLAKLSNEEVVVKIIHSGVGAINETDVILASASSAIIIGFNVRPDASAKKTADTEKVDIRLYSVIYKAIEDIDAAMKGMLDPIFEEKIIGHAEIRQIFKASAIGNIAGSYVLDGNFERDCSVRVSREGKEVFEGKLASLKRFKDDVKEVKKGFECGLVFEDWDSFQENDIVEAYKMVEVPRN